jgi:hypothetical protein
MGQNNSTKLTTRKLKGVDSVTTGEKFFISSYNLKNNLGFAGGVRPVYLDNYWWKEGDTNILPFSMKINTSISTKYGNLQVQGGQQFLLFKNDLNKSTDMVFPYLGSANQNEGLFRINDEGQLFISVNNKEYQIYHINREATGEEQQKFRDFYKAIYGTDVTSSIIPHLKDLAGWRITESREKQSNFVIRGENLNIFPRDPSVLPPQYPSGFNFDVNNWPFKLVNTKSIPTANNNVGTCTGKVGAQSCLAGIPDLSSDPGYKTVSGYWYIGDTDQPRPEKSLLVVDNSKFSTPASPIFIWGSGNNSTHVYRLNCPPNFKSLGSFASNNIFANNVASQINCVKNDNVKEGNQPNYASFGTGKRSLGNSLYEDAGSGRNLDVSCWDNTSPSPDGKRKLTMSCVGYYSPPPDSDRFEIVTYDDKRKSCLNKGTKIDGFNSGDVNCNDIMIDDCIRSDFSGNCLNYLRDNIKYDNASNGLADWLKGYCDSLTLEQKLSDKYKNFCACYLKPEEYQKAKDDMLSALSQDNPDLKRMLGSIFQSPNKCWFPSCVNATSIKTPGELNPTNPCPSNNFNFCIQKCEINNKGQMGDANCKNDASCTQIFNPPPTPSPTTQPPSSPTQPPSRPTQPPSGPTQPPTGLNNKQKLILFSVGGISLIIIIILVIILSRSKKQK